jgi:tripartite ATP-independent transporter DctM subunit
MVGWIIVAFGVTIFAAVPIGFCLAFVPMLYMMIFTEIPMTVISHEMFSVLDSFPLMAIPLFIMAGQLMNVTGITLQLVKLANALVGHIRGGLAHINIVVSMLFAGLNGSAIADTVSVGTILIPAMKEEGYPPGFSGAVTAASATIGAIIPPSVVMVLYGSILGVSVGGLFAAGIIPGILIGFSLICVAYTISVIRKYPVHSDKFSIRKLLVAIKSTILALLMPVIIIGGIVFGVTTTTEAAGIAVLYAVFLGTVVYRNLSFKKFINVCYQSGLTAGIILLIVGASAPFGWLLTVLDLPTLISNFVTGITTNKYLILLILNIIMLFAGMLLDVTANILILGPILSNIAIAVGVHPLHFALVMVVNLIIGLGTPPVGTTLFAAVPLAKTSVEDISIAIIPFISVQICVLVIITYIPSVCMWIPTLLGFV